MTHAKCRPCCSPACWSSCHAQQRTNAGSRGLKQKVNTGDVRDYVSSYFGIRVTNTNLTHIPRISRWRQVCAIITKLSRACKSFAMRLGRNAGFDSDILRCYCWYQMLMDVRVRFSLFVVTPARQYIRPEFVPEMIGYIYEKRCIWESIWQIEIFLSLWITI